MKVLITGAGGRLGRALVRSLVEAGLEVRALVRPGGSAALPAHPAVEVAAADLRTHGALVDLLQGIDAVVHLAAAMSGSDHARFSETIVATERLFDAIDASHVRRVILCSSFSVYDWLSAHGEADEALPLNPRIYESGGYASAKLWQERLAAQHASTHGWQLTILRPGFIYGAGNEIPSGSLGPAFGRLQIVLSPLRKLPFTHVSNCADAFRAALAEPTSSGAVLNVVDPDAPSAWRYAGEAARRGETRFVRLPIPHVVAWPAVLALAWLARRVLGPSAKLPSLCVPRRFAQGYRPLRFSTRQLRERLHWRAPLALEEALRSTWPTR